MVHGGDWCTLGNTVPCKGVSNSAMGDPWCRSSNSSGEAQSQDLKAKLLNGQDKTWWVTSVLWATSLPPLLWGLCFLTTDQARMPGSIKSWIILPYKGGCLEQSSMVSRVVSGVEEEVVPLMEVHVYKPTPLSLPSSTERLESLYSKQ